MRFKQKKLSDQVIVITGATSGIGLVTARQAARRGAKLVLAARNGEALGQLADEITSAGGQAAYVIADVGSIEDVRRIADKARQEFGGFDTWVNNAGVSVYGKWDEVPLEDQRRVFETDYWGMVHGAMVAAEHLRQRGGTLINIGSVVSDRAIPVQASYSAAKHAVKGFTDALRMELEAEGAPIQVTLIKPTSINTPFTRHAKNYLDTEPELPPPVYAPDVVGEAILYCAEHPERDVIVGGGGKFISLSGRYTPRLADLLMRRNIARMQHSNRPPRPREESSLYAPARDMAERGEHEGYTRGVSLYTKASLHPLVTGAIAVGATGLAVLTVLARMGARKSIAPRSIRRGMMQYVMS